MFLPILLGFPFVSYAKAGDSALSGYAEAGKRSTAQDYEEEDADNEYTFRNFHLKFSQQATERLSYDLGSFVYDKDYKADNALDNISRLVKTHLSYYLKKLEDDSLELDLNLDYKSRRYKNAPRSDYDQISASPAITYKKKDLYVVSIAVGFDNYDYFKTQDNDQSRIFSKLGLERYLLEKKLLLTSSYRIEHVDQDRAGRRRQMQEITGGGDYLFGLLWLYKISTRLEWGQRGTLDDENRDDDYDYTYWHGMVKSEHRLTEQLKTTMAYQYFQKEYLGADLDNNGFYLQNSWDYEVLDDKAQKFWLGLDAEHKVATYRLMSGNSYIKESAGVSANYQRKKDWKASAAYELNAYNYNDPDSDKIRHYVKLLGEKLLLKGDLVLSLELKYGVTDYKQAADIGQESARLAFKYRF